MKKTRQIRLFDTDNSVWEIKKHSSLVQMSHLGTLMERKVMNALIWIAKDELKRQPEQRSFRCDIGLVRHLGGLKDGKNNDLKAALRNLRNNPIEYNIFNKDKKEWGVFSFLAEVKISEEGRGKPTWISFEFPTSIWQAVKHPEMYVRLNLLILRDLNSKHSVALYEFLIDYLKIGKFICSIAQFRALMGIQEGKYSNFTMLKKRALDNPVQEVNAKTDLQVSYELEKVGRKVTAIRFDMSLQKEELEQSVSHAKIREKLADFELEE